MRWVAGSLAIVLWAGCAASEEEIKAEFAGYVAGANTCVEAIDCAVASTGCPLGCGTPVRADRKADVEKKARELIAEYERWGAQCDYKCIGPRPLVCTAGRCAFDETGP